MPVSEPDQIDKKTLEILPEDDTVYTNVQDIAEELPDHAPRFVLLSYPLTLVCMGIAMVMDHTELR
jgi:hypothetical protein